MDPGGDLRSSQRGNKKMLYQIIKRGGPPVIRDAGKEIRQTVWHRVYDLDYFVHPQLFFAEFIKPEKGADSECEKQGIFGRCEGNLCLLHKIMEWGDQTLNSATT